MSESFRALLIGVPYYRDQDIDDLPFIEDDLAELSEALDAAGYEVAIHDVQETDLDSIDSAVESFFQDARDGETLLLYLSGHGIHHNNVDYLVPRGARTSSHDFRRRCLSLDFGSYVERSRAGNVVVFVDACREGITLRDMAASNTAGWSQMQVRQTGERHYCHVYACSPGERARYTTSGTSTFSLFSRALSGLVADEMGPGTLDEVKEQLQSAVDALTAEHNCPRQQVRVRTETDLDSFVVFERPERLSEHPDQHIWSVLLREHPVWKLVEDGPGARTLQEASAALVGRLSHCSDKDDRLLKADPWRPVGFAERMTDRLSWLLSKVLNPEKLALSPAEGALLAVTPFLCTAYRNRAAARALTVEPENLARVAKPSEERARYERFFAGQSRLVRRAGRAADTGDTAGASGIGWWLFHRWLTLQPHEHRDDTLTELTCGAASLGSGLSTADSRLIAEVFGAERLLPLLRALQMAPDPRKARPVSQLAGTTPVEQRVREQLLVALLTVAHRLAIDPTMLPDVVVDHLGIRYAVDLAELHETLRTARWDPRGRTRVLHAACRHPAVGLSLQQQAASLDALLGAIDVHAAAEPQLAPLQDLPVHATADQVQAAATAAGTPAYESTDLRFRLADDRIQELLMGEQLYGDPALAIRELYQNALDACRYREARTDFLRRRYSYPSDWSGRITFTQGQEDGRAYIDCTDNGIGMGERELREVFSHAGMRFADLPEYVEEQAAWQAEGIHLHPNSRFGIGVLSYFMIADDITVTTCRLDADGHPGRRLQVDIAGPGALFYIRDLGRGHDAGTTVRLYLRAQDTVPSCTDLLRRLLWISDYAVTATDSADTLSWSPGVLSPVAPLGSEDPHAEKAVREEDVQVDATSRADVWWCSGPGGVLSDGVWAGIPLFGAVVSLTGRYAPQLTVDRRRALSHDETHVTDLLRQEIPALLRDGAQVLSHRWLSRLAQHGPGLADAVFTQAITARLSPWTVRGHEAMVTAVGCFPNDDTLFEPRSSTAWPVPSRNGPEFSDLLSEWRLLAWAKSGAFPGVSVVAPDAVPLARPTDAALLQNVTDRPARRSTDPYRGPGPTWLLPGKPVPLGHIVSVARATGRTPADVAERLTELGHQLSPHAVLPDKARAEDLLILSRDLDGEPPWLTDDPPVPLGHVLSAARHSGRTPADVAGRLTELGYHLSPSAAFHDRAETRDIPLLRLDQRSDAAWLADNRPVPLGHLLDVAYTGGRTPADVAGRLTELGHQLSPAAVLPDDARPDDAHILSRDLDGRSPWLTMDKAVSLGHVIGAASTVGGSPANVAERLTELGYRLSSDAVLHHHAEADDALLLSRDLDRASPWLVIDEPVKLGHVVGTAAFTERSPADVARRLVELGYQLSSEAVINDHADAYDLLLLNRHLDRESPWLVANGLVPLGDVLEEAMATGRTPAEVAERLTRLGYRLSPDAVIPDATKPDDTLLLSANLDREQPWLEPGMPLPLGHVLSAAARTGRSPAEVAAHLAGFGYRLPGNTPLPPVAGRDDWHLLSLNNSTGGPWLRADEPVALRHILRAAAANKRRPAEVAARLTELGYTLPSTVAFEPV
ncbi:caspase family protein [Streptomyces sp. NPDC126933]|uniref:wHTH domain-containing protein n=1 Tax=unclassified Streptomyces TaxID=2593676 RepID=UPI003647B436